jgi:hypothetical protein
VSGRAGTQPLAQLRPPPPTRYVPRRDGDGLLLPDQNDQPLAASDAGVEKVPLQHGVMLCEHRDDHDGIFRALAFVDGRGIGRHQHVEFPKSIGDGATVEARDDLTGIRVDMVDIAAAAHRAQHLDIADGIETEPFGDPCFYELDDPRYGGFGIVRSHEVEVAVWSGRAEIGDRALVDTMGT